jgi:predicted dehydrogenase
MKNIDRRTFLKKTTAASAGVLASQSMLKASSRRSSANDTINVAVVGIRNRGRDHYRTLAKIPNVKVVLLCDIDERFFPETVAEVEKLTGYKPATETEYKKVLENKDIDAVSIATPNHWHALQTIWACQAEKDVFVEKPVSHTVVEGRKMVEAARKYNRIVQTGTQARSSISTVNAFKFIQEGGLGDIYMAKGLCLKPRASIGHTKNTAIPKGVDWDAFLGPAPYRPFNENRFHYKWHWFWDTGNGDMGNQGIHQADMARWALNKWTHPVRIYGTGDYFVYDSDQETPNVQHMEFEYEDGSLLQFEVRGLGTNPEGEIRIGNLIYGSKGWMKIASEDVGGCQVRFADIKLNSSGFSSYEEEQGPTFTDNDPAKADSVLNHFTNFLDCVRSRDWQALNADILEGHLSTALCHLGNIATQLKRSLRFNPHAEAFINDAEADSYLTKTYRYPYVLPEKV